MGRRMVPAMTPDVIGAEPESTSSSTPEHSIKESLMPYAASSVPSGSQEPFSSELAEAVSSLVAAIRDEGISPKFHRMMIVRHRQQWPVLWKAIDRINKLWPEPAIKDDVR